MHMEKLSTCRQLFHGKKLSAPQPPLAELRYSS
uniref:Uncharacterized protein n=1 Tax=Arundo donax TaxID=35708 RepID=A0A0A9F4V8_ARUDO